MTHSVNSELSKPIVDEYKSNLLKTLLLCYLLLMEGLVSAASGPSLLLFSKNTNRPIEDMGLVFTLRYVGYVVVVLFVGVLLDFFSVNSVSTIIHPQNKVLRYLFSRLEKFILISGVVLMIIGLASSAFVTNFVLLNIASIMQGVGMGCLDCASNIMLVWIWKDAVSPYMLAMHFHFGLGAFLSPFFIQIVELVLKRNPKIQAKWANIDQLKISYPVMSFMMLSAAVLLVFVPLHNKQTAQYTQIHTSSTTDLPEEQSSNQSSLLMKIVAYIKSINPKHSLTGFLTGGALFFYCSNEACFSAFISSYVLLYQRQYFENTSALIVSMFWLAFTVFRFVAIGVNKILPVREMLLLAVLSEIVCLAALVIVKNHVVIWIATILLGCSLACQFPSTMALPAAHLKINLSGFATSFVVMASAVGPAVAAYIVAHHLKYFMPILLFIAVSSLAIYLVLFYMIPPDVKRKPRHKIVNQ